MLERTVTDRHPNIGNIGCTYAYTPFRRASEVDASMRAINLSAASFERQSTQPG